MTGSRDIFTKVTDPKERDKVYYDLAATKSEIVGKVHGSDSETYLLKAKFHSQNELECDLMNVKTLPKTGEMIMQITLGAEKYLCSSPFHLRADKVFFKTNVDLFHLQRREDFRLRLPMSYKASLIVKLVNTKVCNAQFQVVDLSGGGCKVINGPKNFDLKEGDIISGELELPDRPTIVVKGAIRHIRDDEKEKTKSFGIQFSDLSAPAKNKIIALVMDLYRELFSRLSKK